MNPSPTPPAIKAGKHAKVVKVVSSYLFKANPRTSRRLVKELLREFSASKQWSKRLTYQHKMTMLYECEQLLKFLKRLQKCQS